jgi:hypothetical protein
MNWKLASLTSATLAFTVLAYAQENPAELEGYRTDTYRAAVPATLTGARVLSTEEAEAIWRTRSGIFIDVLPRPPPTALFHLLLDHAAKGEQTLLDRSWYFADELDHTPSVLENPRFPHQMVAQFIYLGLVRRGRILQGLQRQRIGANSVRGFAMLARYSFKPIHHR